IDINDETNEVKKEHMNLIQRVLRYALEHEKVPEVAEVAVTIVKNERIKELNQIYRNINEPTDVLSFAVDDPFAHIETTPVHIGDIVISHDKVIEQATRYN